MGALAHTQNSEVEEVAMPSASGVIRRCQQSSVTVLTIVVIGVLVLAVVRLNADSGSPGPLAQSCGLATRCGSRWPSRRRTWASAVSTRSISCQIAACVVAWRAQ